MSSPTFKKRKIKSMYELGIFCSECINQPLVQSPEVLDSYPPIYVFQCPVCRQIFHLSSNDLPKDLIEYDEWELIERGSNIIL